MSDYTSIKKRTWYVFVFILINIKGEGHLKHKGQQVSTLIVKEECLLVSSVVFRLLGNDCYGSSEIQKCALQSSRKSHADMFLSTHHNIVMYWEREGGHYNHLIIHKRCTFYTVWWEQIYFSSTCLLKIISAILSETLTI